MRRGGVLTRREFFRPEEWQTTQNGVSTPGTTSSPETSESDSLEQLLLKLFSQ